MYSCSESSGGDKNPLIQIQGEWLNETDSVLLQWTFRNHEVKMGTYVHFFQLEENQLSISGIKHEIKQLNKDTLRLINQEGVEYIFVRRIKEKLNEKA